MRTTLRFVSRFTQVLPTVAVIALASGCASSLKLIEIQKTSEKPSNVAVYFKVEDGLGDPVGGATAEQFNIYEDGSLVSVYESQQTILNPEVAADHYTLLLVDMSGSVSESEDASSVSEAASLFASKVEQSTKVAIYAFDGREDVQKIMGFTKSSGGAEAKAGNLGGYEGKDPSTNLNGAVVQGIELLDEALEKADNPLRFGTLVVFTDGTDRAARVSKEEMLDAVNATDYEVFAIGLGAEMSEDELEAIGKSGTAMAADRTEVSNAFDAVAERIEGATHSYYLLSYCSPARAGEHEVRIELAMPLGGDKKGTRKGSMETNFDAEGFGPDCDPNKAPKFDVTMGDRLRAQQEDEPKRKKLFRSSAQAKADADAK